MAWIRKLAMGGVLSVSIGAGAIVYMADRQKGLMSVQAAMAPAPIKLAKFPTRAEQLKSLKDTPEFDIVIIGGGATGAGIALDAASRGLKTALIEKEDFSCGTSSRSTKLIHGGVRYLEKAVWQLDYGQYELVKEALHERAHLLRIAPHLSFALPIMIPLKTWWQIPYYYVGTKFYDFVAGRQKLQSSYFLSKSRALEEFPMIQGKGLTGAMVYYDGSHNDARMCLAIALTAVDQGAVVANHMEVTSLLKKNVPVEQEKIPETEKGQDKSDIEKIDTTTIDKTPVPQVCGVRVVDEETKESFDVHAKCVINATGPFTDSIRLMDDPTAMKIVQPSSGVHVVLPGYYSPQSMGLLDPRTSDGRVIFFLPWLNSTIAGTTDAPTTVTDRPVAHEEEILFILNEIKNYLNADVQVRRGDVLSAWSGIRPLVSDPSSGSTENITRSHLVTTSSSGLLTIAGGKWTTYRSMAMEAVDVAIEQHGLNPTSPCRSEDIMLHGSEGYTPTLFIRLVQEYGLSHDVAQHLVQTYGDKAFQVAELAGITGMHFPVVGNRLAPDYPYIDAEVHWAMNEYALTAVDVIARRTRLAFLNTQAAEQALPRIVDIMAKKLGWNAKRKQAEFDAGMAFLHTTGLGVRESIFEKTLSDFSKEEILKYRKQFERLAVEDKRSGSPAITLVALRRAMSEVGHDVSDSKLREMIAEVDTDNNGSISFPEFLMLQRSLRDGKVSNNLLAVIAAKYERRIGVHRSGGGL